MASAMREMTAETPQGAEQNPAYRPQSQFDSAIRLEPPIAQMAPNESRPFSRHSA